MLPAPAGTTWRVLAGYNTATHTGEDPHALDLVRTDGPTAGTDVLAPVEGVAWTSSDCVGVRIEGGPSLLMCHVNPRAGLRSGDRVSRGDVLARVAADGEANNAGIAHIHLAVHTRLGGDTLPFVGEWALEGVALPATGASNAYAGRSFRSSNGAASSAAAPDAPPDAPPAASAAAQAEPSSLQAGDRAVVVDDGSCLRLRAEPGMSGEVVGCIEGGSEVLVLPGAAEQDGYRWRLVRADSRVGWAAERFLRRAEARAERATTGAIIAGDVPRQGGLGLFVFGGGTFEQLLSASGCPPDSATFWATDESGVFVPFVPGSAVTLVNADWRSRFPDGIPPGTALLGRCS